MLAENYLLFSTFRKGIFIGLAISVPIGPIGMLIIQRTLNKGRNHGLITGIGATSSDLLYSVITMFFLTFVIGFIEAHKMIIQIIGSLIIIGFGVFTYKSNPVTQPSPNEKAVQHSLKNDYFSSFALTLSNPLILFVLIALFAQLEFITLETTLFIHIVGLLGILTGAFLWWMILTFLVSRFRNKFNVRGLKLINQITGFIMMLIGLAGVIISIFFKNYPS